MKHGVNVKITNTAHKKNMFKRATFITKENRHRIFLRYNERSFWLLVTANRAVVALFGVQIAAQTRDIFAV